MASIKIKDGMFFYFKAFEVEAKMYNITFLH